MEKIRILTVCRWPLGGIRTYLRYNYPYLKEAGFDITVLASDEIETKQLIKDLGEFNIEVKIARPVWGKNILCFRIAQLLAKRHFDVIHSQGFISGFHASLANQLFRKKHVLTLHGLMEGRYFKGLGGKIKLWLFARILKNISIFHAVGEDMAEHLLKVFHNKKDLSSRIRIIKNGIIPDRFIGLNGSARRNLKEKLGLNDEVIVFGFMGRFMPEKGFDYVIKAAEHLDTVIRSEGRWMIIAVGSGDYEREYKQKIKNQNLESIFRFLPFDPNIQNIIKGCDAILMPSVWEAYPILSSEVLTAGTPLIASQCMGLREAIEDTPAIKIPPGDALRLAEAMQAVLTDPDLHIRFENFRAEAARRFDVKNSALKLKELFQGLVDNS